MVVIKPGIYCKPRIHIRQERVQNAKKLCDEWCMCQVQKTKNFKAFFWKERSERSELSMARIRTLFVDYGALGVSVNPASPTSTKEKVQLWVASGQKNQSNNMAELPIQRWPHGPTSVKEGVTHIRYARSGVGQEILWKNSNPRTF